MFAKVWCAKLTIWQQRTRISASVHPLYQLDMQKKGKMRNKNNNNKMRVKYVFPFFYHK